MIVVGRMKSLAPHDRPREKLDQLGSSVLGDNEFLAIILGHGFYRESALDIANHVLAMSGGVQGLTRLTKGQLQRVGGVGPAKAPRYWPPSSWDAGRCHGHQANVPGFVTRRMWPHTSCRGSGQGRSSVLGS